VKPTDMGAHYPARSLMYVFNVRGWHVRIFAGAWLCLPFCWHRWGLYAFGVGPLSVNVWPKKKAPDDR